uniref:Glucosamine 6-phosphate N-acetyltransferase n=1 Tax=Cacopsylla melanoneura TaxID=428564 RepID=A0A8D8SX10_9HEMI
MKESGEYFVSVIEDTRTQQVVGTATLVLEQKFIHECALKGKIEDVVVDNTYRGKELGKLLIAILVKLAKHFKCYKLALDCADHMIPFYETFGFEKKHNLMLNYF